MLFVSDGMGLSGRSKRRERRRQERRDVEPIVLTKKLSEVINGIVLAGHKVGDRLVLAKRQAAMLIAEGWARPVPPHQRRRGECCRGHC